MLNLIIVLCGAIAAADDPNAYLKAVNMNKTASKDNTITALIESLEENTKYENNVNQNSEVDEHYFQANVEAEYGFPPQWTNIPHMLEHPAPKNRNRDRISLNTVDEPIFEVEKTKHPLVDFYQITRQVYLISDNLRNIITDVESTAVDCIEVGFPDFTPSKKYWLCMPEILLEAVDVSRSSVGVIYHKVVDRYVRRIYFPSGVIFDPNVTQGVSNFTDLDCHGWFWSRELARRAQAEGIKGISFARPGDRRKRRVAVD